MNGVSDYELLCTSNDEPERFQREAKKMGEGSVFSGTDIVLVESNRDGALADDSTTCDDFRRCQLWMEAESMVIVTIDPKLGENRR